jgi:undecaprenyl-diphosphatase
VAEQLIPGQSEKAAQTGALLMLGLLGAALGLVLFGWLADSVVRGATLQADLHIRTAVHQFSSPELTRAMLIVTSLGSPIFLAAATGLAVISFLSLNWHRGALWMLIAMAGAGVLDVAMKHSFHRPRPAPFFGYLLPHSESFPSGHALASLCFYGIVAALLSARVRTRGLQVSFWVVAAAVTIAIGFSRIYLGVHYFSDVLGGYLAAGVWLGSLMATDQFYGRRVARLSRRVNPHPGFSSNAAEGKERLMGKHK